jgi:hypothetical protein
MYALNMNCGNNSRCSCVADYAVGQLQTRSLRLLSVVTLCITTVYERRSHIGIQSLYDESLSMHNNF